MAKKEKQRADKYEEKIALKEHVTFEYLMNLAVRKDKPVGNDKNVSPKK